MAFTLTMIGILAFLTGAPIFGVICLVAAFLLAGEG